MLKIIASKSFTLLVSIVMSLSLKDDVEIGTILKIFKVLVEGKIFANIEMSLTACFRMTFFCLVDLSTSFTKLTITSHSVFARTIHFHFAFFTKYSCFLELKKRQGCLCESPSPPPHNHSNIEIIYIYLFRFIFRYGFP